MATNFKGILYLAGINFSFVIAIFKCIVSYEVASRISGMIIIVSVTIIGEL